MPFFSVIVPVYNVERYLPECLASLETQSFRDWECLCIDDGGPDASGALLDEAVRRDGRFKVVHQPNRGVSCARNRGADLASGEYGWFVDADDVVAPDALARIRRACVCDKPRIVRIGWWEFVDGQGDAGTVCSPDSLADAVLSREAFLTAGLMTAMPPAYVWRCTDYLNAGLRFPSGLVYEDMEWAARMLHWADRYRVLAAPLYGYRRGIDSATAKPFSALRLVSYIRMADTVNRELIANELSAAVAAFLRDWSESMGWNALQFYWRFCPADSDRRRYRAVAQAWRASRVRSRRIVGRLIRCGVPLWGLSFLLYWVYRIKRKRP